MIFLKFWRDIFEFTFQDTKYENHRQVQISSTPWANSQVEQNLGKAFMSLLQMS